MKTTAVVIFVATAWLVTCCTALQAPMPTGTSVCPTVRDWSSTDQADLLMATRAWGSSSALLALWEDWQRMRDEARACQIAATSGKAKP